MSLLSRRLQINVARRGLSTAAVESPKITIARNVLRLKQLAEAKDEAALQAAATAALPAVDPANLPKELASLSGLFALGGSSTTSEKFIPDPKAWQNKGFFDFAGEEVQRSETWPFFVGFVVVNLILGVGLASALPKDAKKNSKYIQLMEGKQGHDDHHAHH